MAISVGGRPLAGCRQFYVWHPEALYETVFSVEVGADVRASRGNNSDRLGVAARLDVSNVDNATIRVSCDSAVGSC